MLLQKQLLSPPLPCSSLYQLISEGLDVPIHIMVNTVCQYKKRQQLQLFKMRQNLGKTISHLAETAMDSLEVL